MYSVFCLMLIRVTQVLMVTYDYLKARKFKQVVSDTRAIIVFVMLYTVAEEFVIFTCTAYTVHVMIITGSLMGWKQQKKNTTTTTTWRSR